MSFATELEEKIKDRAEELVRGIPRHYSAERTTAPLLARLIALQEHTVELLTEARGKVETVVNVVEKDAAEAEAAAKAEAEKIAAVVKTATTRGKGTGTA